MVKVCGNGRTAAASTAVDAAASTAVDQGAVPSNVPTDRKSSESVQRGANVGLNDVLHLTSTQSSSLLRMNASNAESNPNARGQNSISKPETGLELTESPPLVNNMTVGSEDTALVVSPTNTANVDDKSEQPIDDGVTTVWGRYVDLDTLYIIISTYCTKNNKPYLPSHCLSSRDSSID